MSDFQGMRAADFKAVTDGLGDTPATAPRLQSVPEVVALLGLAVIDALRDAERTGSYCYETADDDGFPTLNIGATVYLSASLYSDRLTYLLRQAGVNT